MKRQYLNSLVGWTTLSILFFMFLVGYAYAVLSAPIVAVKILLGIVMVTVAAELWICLWCLPVAWKAYNRHRKFGE